MKKYVLAKDLPYAKAGEPVKCNDIGVYVSKGETVRYIDKTLGEIDARGINSEIQRLIDEGWIKEVKPLEVWFNIYKYSGAYYETKEAAIANHSDYGYIRTAKFVEAEE